MSPDADDFRTRCESSCLGLFEKTALLFVREDVLNKRTIVMLLCVCVLLMGAVALAQKAPETVVLKGAPAGGVKFNHKAHVDMKLKCDTCHHASKPEKPMKAAQEKCQDCHTKTAAAPLKTNTMTAFHNTCLTCHKAEAAKGKPAPTKCADCHKKENV